MIGYQELTYNLWDDHFKVMLYRTIRNDDFLHPRSHVGTGRRNEVGFLAQHTVTTKLISKIASNSCKIVPTLQRCVAIIIVAANLLV